MIISWERYTFLSRQALSTMIYNEGNEVPLPNLDLLTLLFGKSLYILIEIEVFMVELQANWLQSRSTARPRKTRLSSPKPLIPNTSSLRPVPAPSPSNSRLSSAITTASEPPAPERML